jgi:hypothetical protein
MFSVENKNKLIGNLIFFIFIIFISTTVYLSKVLKNDQNVANIISQNLKLFKVEEIKQITKIHIKNKNGDFEFEKSEADQAKPWLLTSPKQIALNSHFLDNLFTFLTEASIKKTYLNDKLNNSNFSLEKPTATITLNTLNNIQFNIDVGLSNSIDNSIYIKSSNRPGIIHIESPTFSFENISLFDLIESQIFYFDLDKISKIKIFKNKKSNEPFFEIFKKDQIWLSTANSKIDLNKLKAYIQELTFLKSDFIIDKQTELQKKQINILKKNPEFIFSIEESNKMVTEYNISSITKEISDIEMKNEPHFVITSSQNSSDYIIKKEFYNLFEIKIEKFKEIEPRIQKN